MNIKPGVAACTAFYLGLLPPAMGQGDGQSLTRGSFVLRPARVISIPAGTNIHLTADTVLAADQIKLDGTIVTDGFLLHLDAREIVWGPAAKIAAFEGPPPLPPGKPQASRGRDGLPNYSAPRNIRNGGPGNPGNPGNPGIPGHVNPGPILYIVGHTTKQINIDARGQDGGKGGLGGQGGVGGNGAPGRSASASCDGWGSSCVGYSGPGWAGGEPGNGGQGGRGGKGGPGGRAVPLIVALGDLAGHNQDQLLVGPGIGGQPGDPGLPGNPGSAGVAGRADGCCGGPFGLLCCDKSGAPGGSTPVFPDPGHLGSEGSGEAGQDVDPNLPVLTPFAQHPSRLSPNGASVDLSPLFTKQASVLSAMSEFHATRTYTYLLTRSLALIGYSLPSISSTRSGLASLNVPSQPDADVAAIVGELWRTAFVDPLQAAIDSGNTSFPAIRDWLARGRQTVELLVDAANSRGAVMPAKLVTLYRNSQSAAVDQANNALAVCHIYSDALSAIGSQAILLSHHVAIPACAELPGLSGAQLFLAPLTMHEALPDLPDAFKPYLSDSPIQIAQASGRSSSFATLLGRMTDLLSTPANAQAISVQVRAASSTAAAVLPKEIGLDPRRLNGRRFLVATSLQSSPTYSAAELLTDLRIFSEMVR